MIVFWLVGGVFLAGFTFGTVRARAPILWLVSRVSVGLGSTLVLIGSSTLVIIALVQGASSDGWAIILGLTVSSGLTLVGTLRLPHLADEDGQ